MRRTTPATDEARFRDMDLLSRVLALKQEGEYLGSRVHGGHQVHLYRMEGFFAEVWMRAGLRSVEWAEVCTNSDILSEYVQGPDLRDLL